MVLKQPLLSPCAGDLMKSASGEFADDPCSSVKRGNMVRAARALLSAVTRLLILADMADVYKLLVQLKVVSVGLCCAWHARGALPGARGVRDPVGCVLLQWGGCWGFSSQQNVCSGCVSLTFILTVSSF